MRFLVLRTAIAPPVWRGESSRVLGVSRGLQPSVYLLRTVLSLLPHSTRDHITQGIFPLTR